MMRKISLLICGLLLAACTSKKANKDTFIFCSEGSPSSFNPQLAADGPSFSASSQTIYNRLVDFKKGSTEVVPSLAESWSVSSDGLVYTFKLKTGVKFHTTKDFTPTREFNADDVIFTFARQMDKENPYHAVNGGTYEYFRAMAMDKMIKSVTKTDDYTVVFTLSRKEAPFVANLGMDFASILSKEYADNLLTLDKKEMLDTDPVGTGPFVFKKYLKDTLIRYSAHTEYFEGAAKIKNLVFSITPDPSVRTQKLKAGECHHVSEVAPQDIESLKNNKNIKMTHLPGMNVGYMVFNTEKPPFNNLKIRKAIFHALNRQSYMKAIYHGYAEVAENAMPPVVWGYNNNLPKYEYSVEKAKELLAEAGYKDGFETTIWTLPISRPYNPDGKKMGELMQADLAKVGIKVKLISYDWPTYLDKVRQGEHDMAQWGWSGDNGDPDNFLGTLLSCDAVKPGANSARWCNKEFSKLINEAKQKNKIEERTALYKKAQVIFKQQVPWVTLAHTTVYRAMQSNIEGYVQSPLGTENFYSVEIK